MPSCELRFWGAVFFNQGNFLFGIFIVRELTTYDVLARHLLRVKIVYGKTSRPGDPTRLSHGLCVRASRSSLLSSDKALTAIEVGYDVIRPRHRADQPPQADGLNLKGTRGTFPF